MTEGWSDGAKMAIALIVTGFVLFIVTTVMMSGRAFMNDYMTTVVNTQAEVMSAEIEALAIYAEDLPAASVYVALAKNSGFIDAIDGTAYGVTVTTIEDLKELFKHEIHVTIIKNNTTGMYRVTISP